ncbi:methionine biosynthesis protein MetW [Desulfovibrio mangrovi]|uniref:methionine biosynthesis protein MetW n=1 Tax=Desulfovibrio mangrovi TaxID=2976983 RepID=UPI002246B55F|nr:methionine biosynthesis protein MetW [Desulfovibrio mangrovi]UZP67228.1 methionine biosynthesis protein MetW [Desulfovibrio mangrovi]
MSANQTAALRPLRFDQQVIASWIEPETRVLDLGCGDGQLLGHLVREKQVHGTGIELSEAYVAQCIGQGLSVVHGNVNEELPNYPDKAFDYVIVSQTLQQVHRPTKMLEQLLRVGRFGIVSFPNFGYWKVRLQAMFGGRAPKTRELPYEWYDTPNIRVLTLEDFRKYGEEIPFRIMRQEAVAMPGGDPFPRRVNLLPNLRASYGIFMIEGR